MNRISLSFGLALLAICFGLSGLAAEPPYRPSPAIQGVSFDDDSARRKRPAATTGRSPGQPTGTCIRRSATAADLAAPIATRG